MEEKEKRRKEIKNLSEGDITMTSVCSPTVHQSDGGISPPAHCERTASQGGGRGLLWTEDI